VTFAHDLTQSVVAYGRLTPLRGGGHLRHWSGRSVQQTQSAHLPKRASPGEIPFACQVTLRQQFLRLGRITDAWRGLGGKQVSLRLNLALTRLRPLADEEIIGNRPVVPHLLHEKEHTGCGAFIA
jgi:hypothetical protein